MSILWYCVIIGRFDHIINNTEVVVMRLMISESKNAKSLYVIKSVYKNGKHSTKIIEKLGAYDDLLAKLNGEDPIKWAKDYIETLNEEEAASNKEVLVKYSPSKQIDRNKQRTFNCGYLFLQKLYHQLGLHTICKDIGDKHNFSFDLDNILSRLVYSRILYPSSKLSTYEQSKNFIEQPNFELQHIYRGLEIISNETDYIQAQLYKNSKKCCKRNKAILYYDCTNFFFEIEQEEGLKKYGYSKEHKPNPIVQMGLFMDAEGIPLAFNISSGNTNEQITLQPLEKKIISDFNLSKFIVCTDAGLASISNRKFNSIEGRSFITTQSVKNLNSHLKEWALDPKDWHLAGKPDTFNINELNPEKDRDKIFYKERWIKEKDSDNNFFEQKLIVTFSLKYKLYQETIRNSQIERALKQIEKNPSKISKHNQNDYKRFISSKHSTKDGETADKTSLAIDYELIEKEQQYDGFYAVCTNLDSEPSKIIEINSNRWEIEESFRIMKSEFKARPVYLRRDDRIHAHFTTCFISLMIFRLLEKKLNEKYTCSNIISTLKNMNLCEIPYEGYFPLYERNDLTDDLHDVFGFHTDLQIVNNKTMKKIFKDTKI